MQFVAKNARLETSPKQYFAIHQSPGPDTRFWRQIFNREATALRESAEINNKCIRFTAAFEGFIVRRNVSNIKLLLK